MYNDNIKLFAKTEKKLETLIQVVRIYNQDIGMEFGMDKCVMQIMRSGKRQMTGKNEISKIRTLGQKETYTHQTREDERKIKKGFLWRTRKLLETKLHGINITKEIKTMSVSLVRFSAPFLDEERTSTKEPENKKSTDDT